MDPAKRSRNLFFAVLILLAIAVSAFKLFLYRSALAASFQTTGIEERVVDPESNATTSQP